MKADSLRLKYIWQTWSAYCTQCGIEPMFSRRGLRNYDDCIRHLALRGWAKMGEPERGSLPPTWDGLICPGCRLEHGLTVESVQTLPTDPPKAYYRPVRESDGMAIGWETVDTDSIRAVPKPVG